MEVELLPKVEIEVADLPNLGKSELIWLIIERVYILLYIFLYVCPYRYSFVPDLSPFSLAICQECSILACVKLMSKEEQKVLIELKLSWKL